MLFLWILLYMLIHGSLGVTGIGFATTAPWLFASIGVSLEMVNPDYLCLSASIRVNLHQSASIRVYPRRSMSDAGGRGQTPIDAQFLARGAMSRHVKFWGDCGNPFEELVGHRGQKFFCEFSFRPFFAPILSLDLDVCGSQNKHLI